MTCHDWRTCTPEEGAALVGAEIQVWLHELGWDLKESWSVIEPARRSGSLPGFVVRDDSRRPVGWAACTQMGGAWHVFVFNASNSLSADLLLHAVTGAAHAAGCTSVVFSVRDTLPDLRAKLATCGFLVDTYRYLSKPLPRNVPAPTPLSPWRHHERAMAELCARAYRGVPGVRAFAADDTLESWEDYIHSLVTTPGCGRFAGDLSGVVERADGALDGAVMVTRLGPGTIHIAQLAVDPASRRRGVGGSLVDAVTAAGTARGARDVTLLVSAANARAVRLYEARGFADRAAFLVATRQPSLSTSLALETGGASTRR